jgi:hypothetical protein
MNNKEPLAILELRIEGDKLLITLIDSRVNEEQVATLNVTQLIDIKGRENSKPLLRIINMGRVIDNDNPTMMITIKKEYDKS